MKHINISFDIEEVTEIGTLKENEELKKSIIKGIRLQFFPAVLEHIKIRISKSDIKEQ